MLVYLWDDQHSLTQFPYPRYAYKRNINGKYTSLYGDKLEMVNNYNDRDPELFESDVLPEMRVLIDAYDDSDEPSKGHKIVVIDIETSTDGGFPDIMTGDKTITAIALYDQSIERYYCFILDPDGKVEDSTKENVHLRSFRSEEGLLNAYLNKWEEIGPTIVSGWNCIPLDQSVWTKNKIVKIKDINSVELYDSKLLNKYPISVKEKWSIELSNGKKIYSSGDHKFPVMLVNPNEYITFKESNKSNFIKIDLKTRQIKSFNECADVYCAIQLRKNINLQNEKYTLSQLYLAGLIYTDGSLKDKSSKTSGYTFYQSDYEFIKKLDKFGVNSDVVGPYKGCYSRNIKRTIMGSAHELIYDSHYNKKLNIEELSTLSYEQFMMFLSGLFDGDGYVSANNISWCNYNNDLNSLHELCNWNGIFCTQGKHYLRFIDFSFKDLSLLKNKRWDKSNISILKRDSKQKSKQIRFKKIGDVYWVKVKEAKYIGTSTRMMDIETDTHYFITGGVKTHNCNGFDLPYLYNRIRAVLGNQSAYRLSPINIAYQNRFNKRMIIAGISCLDYMDLYKKFLGVMKSSYSLSNVAKDENLKHQKLTYRGDLNDLYKTDIHRFVEYNLVDVKIVVELDKKYDFIYLAQTVCHKGHVPYEWFQMSSRFIDGAILMYLKRNNLIAPNKPVGGREEYDEMEKNDEDGFTGAYVKEPIPGLYDWIYSADITSLYPSVIMSLNISPETKIGKIENWDRKLYDSGQMNTISTGTQAYSLKDFRKMIDNYTFSISSNGIVYRQDVKGVIPTILDTWFSERIEFRNLAKKYSDEGNKEKSEFYNRRQLRQKIFLNSVYGTLGLPIFRFYDRDNAEATTISGQTIIRGAEELVNDLYKKKFAAKNVPLPEQDFVKYIDTDSLYVSAMPLARLEDKMPEMKQFTINLVTEVADLLNRFYEYMIPRIFNVAPANNRIKIIPDVIAKKALWLAKKRYVMLKVHDMEKNKSVQDKDGNEGKLEVKGIDVVRSSFPAAFRKFASEILDMILRSTDRKIIDEKIMVFEECINNPSVIDLAKTSSVKYISKNGEHNYNPSDRRLFQFIPGSPPQVKAALAYNDFMKIWKLDKQVERIQNGSKIKWVYLLPNDFCIETLAIKADDTDPDQILEFIDHHIDRKKIYERELKSKQIEIYRCIGWNYPNRGAELADKTFDFDENW